MNRWVGSEDIVAGAKAQGENAFRGALNLGRGCDAWEPQLA